VSVDLQVGDRVAWSADFCKRAGLTGPAAQHEGTVVSILPMRVPRQAVRVKWDGGYERGSLAINLRKISREAA
jgi:hypothetical protein